MGTQQVTTLHTTLKCDIPDIPIEIVVVSRRAFSEVLCRHAQKDNYATATCELTEQFCGYGSWNASYRA